jgi:hypothetical protein
MSQVIKALTKPIYEVILVCAAASGIRSRIASWSLDEFNDLTDIEDDRRLAGAIRSARESFERNEGQGSA